ncbi:alkaline phosphatase family protein [Fodinicola acaciae]|uniref:alkaline phosphatase family protein n=1 Tax=Fodinicola acaciae TaxID=2681555 RepID=UPI001FE81F30|nr:alkaline phosphatase family protein [Fodinicola acaciae]
MHLPAYGRGSLAVVLPSVAAALGIPGFTDTLGVAATTGPLRRACVLLVDGLGWQLLTAHPDVAPTMNAMVKRSITTAFPATTATSVTTVGTGVPPGLHGVVGYKVAIPGKGRIMNSLRWDNEVDPLVWQPHEPVLARAAGAGLAVHHVGPKFHDGGGLTRASTRGARFRPAYGLGDLAAGAAAVTASAEWALTYAYFADLDTVGHVRGSRSDAWRAELAHVDLMVGALRDMLPPDAALVVIADHGMIDVPTEQRVDCDTTPELRDGVVLLGGEGRARHLYTRPGAADDVRETWSGFLGDRATAVTREQAIADGWFGPRVDDGVRDRIGDVVVSAGPDLALIASEREPMESNLVGLHGGMEPAEQLVPLLVSPGTT